VFLSVSLLRPESTELARALPAKKFTTELVLIHVLLVNPEAPPEAVTVLQDLIFITDRASLRAHPPRLELTVSVPLPVHQANSLSTEHAWPIAYLLKLEYLESANALLVMKLLTELV
jgi:hypothetical protein